MANSTLAAALKIITPYAWADRRSPAKRSRGRRMKSASTSAIIEMLEGRRLLSVSMVSVNSQGVAGNGPSDVASTSQDGTYVAFSTYATNLGGSVQSGKENIYLRDTATGTTTLVSAGMNGAASNGDSDSPKVSANGQYVVFASDATNLVPNDTSTLKNIFVWNSATNSIKRVSATPGGGNPNGLSEVATISANGQFVAFGSYADNLVTTPAITTQHDNVYLANLQTGHITLVSVDAAGNDGGNGASYDPKISGDGTFVTFRSTATNLETAIPIANPGGFNIYVRNITTGTTSLVSVDAAGTASGNGNSISASISDNGEYVLFRSSATNLVSNDNSTQDQVYLRNTMTNTTTLLSADTTRTGAANGFSEFPFISDDGRWAAFSSTGTNLIPDDTNPNEQVYVRDLQNGPIYLLSVDNKTGLPGNGASYHTYESTNGEYVTFTSAATDLTPTQNSGVTQVYIATAPSAGGGTTTGNGSGSTSGATETTPPTASVAADQITPTVGATTYQFTVDLSDAVALNTVSLGNLIVNGPEGMQTADYVSEVGSGPSAVATYQITFPAPLSSSDDGVYNVSAPAGAILNAAGIDLTQGQTPPVSIGSFTLSVPPATAPDLTGSFVGKLPASVIGGKKGSAKLVVTNVGVNPIVKTKLSFALYVSQAPTILPGASPVRVVTQKLSLKHGKSAGVKFNFTYPNSGSVNGQYYLVAQLDSTDVLVESNRANSTVASPKTITIAPPFKALNAVSVVPTTTTLVPGAKSAVAVVTVQNKGNTGASGPLTIDLTAPTGAGDISGTGEAIATVVTKINIKPGGSSKLKIKYTVSPGATAESGFLSATIDPSNVFKNPDQDDNIATSTIGITVS